MTRVLLCDDDQAVAATIARSLSLAGYDTTKVEQPSEALNKVSGPNPPDLLITDLVLRSRISGIDLASRALKIRPSLPIIILTGYFPDEAEFRSEKLHDVVVMHKPVARLTLLETLDRLIIGARSKGIENVNQFWGPTM